MPIGRYSIAAVLAACCLASAASAQDVTRAPLESYRVPNSAIDVFTVLSELLPGRTTGRHIHPGAEMTFVVEGQVTVMIDGQPDNVVKAGGSFLVEAMKPHEIVASQEGNAKVILTYVVARGQPATVLLGP